MPALIAFALCVWTPAQRQRTPKGPSLAVFLQRHPWDLAHKGPMLALDPDSAIAADDGDRLESFGRQEFRVGSVTTIAPTQMVYIDTSLKDPANLYQGLKREDKVTYLMTLLDRDQWRLAQKNSPTS